jgi:hypothetical protein
LGNGIVPKKLSQERSSSNKAALQTIIWRMSLTDERLERVAGAIVIALFIAAIAWLASLYLLVVLAMRTGWIEFQLCFSGACKPDPLSWQICVWLVPSGVALLVFWYAFKLYGLKK